MNCKNRIVMYTGINIYIYIFTKKKIKKKKSYTKKTKVRRLLPCIACRYLCSHFLKLIISHNLYETFNNHEIMENKYCIYGEHFCKFKIRREYTST